MKEQLEIEKKKKQEEMNSLPTGQVPRDKDKVSSF